MPRRIDVQQRTKDKAIILENLLGDGRNFHSIKRTRTVMKDASDLMDEDLSAKLSRKRGLDAKLALGDYVDPEELADTRFTDSETEVLLIVTWKQLAELVVDDDGNHPEPEDLADAVDFEVARDLVDLELMPKDRDEDKPSRPPRTSRAGSS